MRFTLSEHRPAQCEKKGDLCHIQLLTCRLSETTAGFTAIPL